MGLKRYFKRLHGCAEDSAGTTSVEYVLLAALIGLAIIGGVSLLETDLREHFGLLGDEVASVMPSVETSTD